MSRPPCQNCNCARRNIARKTEARAYARNIAHAWLRYAQDEPARVLPGLTDLMQRPSVFRGNDD